MDWVDYLSLIKKTLNDIRMISILIRLIFTYTLGLKLLITSLLETYIPTQCDNLFIATYSIIMQF